MSNDEILESALVKLENTANYLRGMALFDKRLPQDIASSVLEKVSEIDDFTSKAIEAREANHD